ncbi:hypothetical protein SAMN04515666_103622 [Bosea lupini]|uniref:Uncharacterized protein n=1 Tax=Bosea lupini TaxID=1036779 RepID=A0A1H7PVW4_9HYPH|nr:hypothetical protein [Bosea lupini]SEL39739.1 hypothetical protein SAMN04515666_103622 [Bosea lupini]
MTPNRLPPDAIPIQRLMFAAPSITSAAVEALGPDATLLDEGREIWLDKDSWGRRWTINGRSDWRRDDREDFATETDFEPGRWDFQEEEPEPHWSGDDRAWVAAVAALVRLLEAGEATLLGRPGEPWAPALAIPLDALPDWHSGLIDFGKGTIDTTSGTIFSVHILVAAPMGSPTCAAAARIHRMASEDALRDWIVARALASPDAKTVSLASLLVQLEEIGLTKGGIRRAWDAAMSRLDPGIRAVWQGPGTLRTVNRSPQSIPEK